MNNAITFAWAFALWLAGIGAALAQANAIENFEVT